MLPMLVALLQVLMLPADASTDADVAGICPAADSDAVGGTTDADVAAAATAAVAATAVVPVDSTL